MSFSSEVKEELSKISNLAKKELVYAELIGYLISDNTKIESRMIKYSTESDYNINRFSKLLNNMQISDYEIDIQGKVFYIMFKTTYIEEIIDIVENKVGVLNISNEEEHIKALFRGLFLGGGSINNPENKYHLELNISNKDNLEKLQEYAKVNNINFKNIVSEDGSSLYLKEGEEISKFLAFIGANKAVLRFEGVRVQREMNNKVNRLVNCETANLNKTINAAVEQIEAINYLKKINKFELLNDSLKEIAIVRVENPNMPLSELGELLSNPVGKSGVNYRLKKIIEIAKEYENKNDE